MKKLSPLNSSRGLSENDCESLLKLTSHDPETRDLNEIVRIMLETGLRVAELRDLSWSRVDFENSKISLPLKDVSAQDISFGPETCKILHDRLQRDPESEFVFGERRIALFIRAKRQLAGIASKLGLCALNVHILRSTFKDRLQRKADLTIEIGGQKVNLDLKLNHSSMVKIVRALGAGASSLTQHRSPAAYSVWKVRQVPMGKS